MRLFFHTMLAAALSSLSTVPVQAEPTPVATYDAPDAWLCRPGRSDHCNAAQVVTRVASDGARTEQVFKADANAPIDCFYVYPTISQDPNANSTLVPGLGEVRAVQQQFAPFASVCRPFAPMYRQITLAGLRTAMGGNPSAVNADLPIEDIRAAWRHYLTHDNQGRGVVLIGHSQGSRTLIELLKRDIHGKPDQKRLVSALLIGFNYMVQPGQDAGLGLPDLPLCRSSTDTGCVVAYTTFRETTPPPGNARFGRSHRPDREVACADPVHLSGQPLFSLLVRQTNLLGTPVLEGEWKRSLEGVDTPFVDFPGMMQVACVKNGPLHYLALSLDSTAKGNRPSNVPGDIVYNGQTLDDWGLHLIDVNVVMGNLLELVRQQGASWLARMR